MAQEFVVVTDFLNTGPAAASSTHSGICIAFSERPIEKCDTGTVGVDPGWNEHAFSDRPDENPITPPLVRRIASIHSGASSAGSISAFPASDEAVVLSSS